MIDNYNRRIALFTAAEAEYEILRTEYNNATEYMETHHPDLWDTLFFPPAPIYIPRRPSYPSTMVAYSDFYVMPNGQKYPTN